MQELTAQVLAKPLRISYRKARQAVGRLLDGVPIWRRRLECLRQIHVLSGFFADDFNGIQSFEFTSVPNLQAEFNPRRRERSKGAGRTTPPEGITSRSLGCFLDPRNIYWMQCATQIPYPMKLNQRLYCWLVQPFPLRKGHLTLAAARRRLQDWRAVGVLELGRLIADIYLLAELLGSGFLIFFNGVDAGATIPSWFHLHVLPVGRLPIQNAASAAQRAAGDSAFPSVFRLDQPYWPLPAFRIAGPEDFVVSQIGSLASRWQVIAGDRATECISAVIEDGEVVFYYVPRDRGRKRATGFGGVVGAYECAAGIFVFDQDNDGRELIEGSKNGDSLWRILLDVRPEPVDQL